MCEFMPMIFPSFPHPIKTFEGRLRRESRQLEKPNVVGQHPYFARIAEFLNDWIPACAGMTG